MFSKALIVLAIVAAALAAPQYQSESSTPIPIISESRNGPNPDGSYSWSYETANGILAREQGSLVQSDNKEALSVSGGYKYIGEDGNPIEITYTADENGYQPQGAHLPVAPPIPEAILKALEWIAAHPEEDRL
uniref:Cuticular protein 4 n=1 Tax=Microplitis mediator TaxID=375433 RepID=A0A650DLE5_9HYME|nr:cuticular protein 4 [Microplitis mediator]